MNAPIYICTCTSVHEGYSQMKAPGDGDHIMHMSLYLYVLSLYVYTHTYICTYTSVHEGYAQLMSKHLAMVTNYRNLEGQRGTLDARVSVLAAR